MSTRLQYGELSIVVLRKHIKHMYLRLHPTTGVAQISAPMEMDIAVIQRFAESRLSWIRRHQQQIRTRNAAEPAAEPSPPSNAVLWGRRYPLNLQTDHGQAGVRLAAGQLKVCIPPRFRSSTLALRRLLDRFYAEQMQERSWPLIEKWERQLEVKLQRLFIRKMKSLWGSCNAAKSSIRLNLELAKRPPECLDYVILHELTHFFVPNHGPDFIARMDAQMPDWRALRKRLNQPLLSGELQPELPLGE